MDEQKFENEDEYEIEEEEEEEEIFGVEGMEERYYYYAVRVMWTYGIVYTPIVAIVGALAQAPSLTYDDALDVWCEKGYEIFGFPEESREMVELTICNKVLAQGWLFPRGIGEWMEKRAEEVRRVADRISA